MSVTGVVWDLGNVLIDWDPLPAIAAGVGPEEAGRFLGADDFDFMAWNHGPDSGGSWADAEALVRREHPHWLDAALSYRQHFARSLKGPVPGTTELLRELHEHGVAMWGLTNWSHELYPFAPERFDVLGLLEGVVVSGTEGVAKPDRRAFELVGERSGVALEHLLMVDDRPANVDGARAAGMQAVLFTGADALRIDLREAGLPV